MIYKPKNIPLETEPSPIEREGKDQNLAEPEIKAIRTEKAEPLLIELKLWLDNHLYCVTPQSPLGKPLVTCTRAGRISHAI